MKEVREELTHERETPWMPVFFYFLYTHFVCIVVCCCSKGSMRFDVLEPPRTGAYCTLHTLYPLKRCSWRRFGTVEPPWTRLKVLYVHCESENLLEPHHGSRMSSRLSSRMSSRMNYCSYSFYCHSTAILLLILLLILLPFYCSFY